MTAVYAMATFDLFSAVKDGDTEAVRDQLTKRNCRSKLNDRNEWGDTVLHLASEAGNSDVCQMLIAGGASVTVRNNRGETCLHRAAVGGHTECVKVIVERDNDPEAINSQNDAGYTALHHSAKHGSIDLIQVLLRAGADRMLENNAGETPYMVAHKYQQFEAERLLLNIEQQHADKAIQEMNSKPKKITAAYSKSLKYAHKPESRIRLVLVGDTGSGKTSLKKTLFGESFDKEEPITKGIQADPSVARIQFRQFREWVMQPSSKADPHRLNLEYNDAIIDYILNEIRKPGLSDEVIDLKRLSLQKNEKNVNFDSIPSIIPDLQYSSSQEVRSNETEPSSVEENEPENNATTDSEELDESDEVPDQVPDEVPDNTEPSGIIDDDTEDISEEQHEARGRQGTIVVTRKQNEEDSKDDLERANEKAKTKLTFFDSTLEVSKILVDHIPTEVLRRLIMRWPVDGEEQNTEQDILNRRRLLIHVWDCSGDPLHLSVVPLFFSHRCIFIMTYNITKELDHPSDSFLSKKLTSLQGSIPTNGEVLEEWLSNVVAHTVDIPNGPFTYQNGSPQLPPLIFVTPHADNENAIPFHQFFARASYGCYKSHVIDDMPNVIAVSNKYEGEFLEEYTGHHFLRREIDYLARQMPYINDMIPVQWVKFEQLLFALLEQKKVIILLQDLERYIAERCDIIGALQVQPVLAHFSEIGVIIHFHRHPALTKFVIIKPQWLLDAIAALFTSSSNNWITGEVRSSFQNLLTEGHIRTEILLLAYRCSRLPQRYWNETLYYMNYMDLIACHPSLHETKAVYIPSMVNQSPPAFLYGPTASDPSTLFFSTRVNVFPVSLYNQLVVHCIRTCQYPPTLFHDIVHLRLNSRHHLILRREEGSLSVLVQSDTESFCRNCQQSDKKSHEVNVSCMDATHIIDQEENSIASEMNNYKSCLSTLEFRDDQDIHQVCPRVCQFLQEHLEFLTSCWHPGLRIICRDESSQVLDIKWQMKMIKRGLVKEKLAIWFM